MTPRGFPQNPSEIRADVDLVLDVVLVLNIVVVLVVLLYETEI